MSLGHPQSPPVGGSLSPRGGVGAQDLDHIRKKPQLFKGVPQAWVVGVALNIRVKTASP